MAFRFRFEKILELKRRIEDALKSELALLTASKEELIVERDRLLGELESLRGELSEEQSKGLKGGELRLYLYLINSLTSLIERKEREIREIEKRIEEKRSELLKASKERRKFERLKERDFESFILEELYRERVILDEIGQNLFLRREESGS